MTIFQSKRPKSINLACILSISIAKNKLKMNQFKSIFILTLVAFSLSLNVKSQEHNLSVTEIQELKNGLQTAPKNVGDTDVNNITTRSYDKSQANLPMEENKKDLSIFGAELFTKNSLVFEPNLRIPTPSSYILGTDDELVINVFGSS